MNEAVRFCGSNAERDLVLLRCLLHIALFARANTLIEESALHRVAR
jgi:hypothetical protein